MKYFVTEIDVLQDLKNAIDRYCSNSSKIIKNIESNIQSKLNELKNHESHITSKIKEAERNLSTAESALSDCESRALGDDDENCRGGATDCRSFESEVSDCKRQLDKAQQKYEIYKHEIQKLENEIDRYQNAMLRFQSSLQYLKDATVTRLLSIISKLDAYVSYTILPTYNSNIVSSTFSSDTSKNINYLYKEFLNDMHAYDWGYSEHSWGRLWKNKLSKEQKESLNRYKQYSYIGINDYLRYGDYSMAANGSYYQFNLIKNDIVNIDNALNISIIPENIISYRGFVDFDCKTGDVIAQKAFESTSLSYKSALNYAEKNIKYGKQGIVAKIYIAKGKKGAFMEGISRIEEDGNEILLPRRTKYKVLSIKYVNGIKHIDLEVL